MLCFVCLTENQDDPNKAVTHVQGTAVCRDHVVSVTDTLALLDKLRQLTTRLQKRPPPTNGHPALTAADGFDGSN